MNSFLSPDVKSQYSISNLICPTTDPILTNTMTLNWNCFAPAKILNGDSINPAFFLKGAYRDDVLLDKITKCVTYVKSCSLFVDNYLKSLSESEFITQYEPSNDFLEIFNLNYSGESFLAGLKITSWIDRLLSQIGRYVQRTRAGPKTKHNQIKKVRLSTKMRVLLESEIMETTLGPDIIFLLRIFIAHPIGINVKNLLWHGFVSGDEHEPSYVAFALVLALSLDEIYIRITAGNYVQLTHSPDIKSTENKSPSLEILETVDLSIAISIIKSSDFVHPTRISTVTKSINFYFEKKYWYFIQLIFPEIENGLRCIYAKINNLDVCTTQSEEKMITLVNILGPNSNIATALGEPIMHLLFDLIVWKSGSQLRDRISHRLIGENSISETEYKYTFALFMLLCLHNKNDLLIEEFNSKYIPMYNPLLISLRNTNTIQKYYLKMHITYLTHTTNSRERNLTKILIQLESKMRPINLNISDFHIYRSKEATQIFSIVYNIYHSCENIYNQLSDQFSSMGTATKLTDRQRASFMVLSDNFYLFGDILHFFKLISEYGISMLLYEPIDKIRAMIPNLVLCQNILIGQLGTLLNQHKRMYTLAIATFFCYLGPTLIPNENIHMVQESVKKRLDSQFLKFIELDAK